MGEDDESVRSAVVRLRRAAGFEAQPYASAKVGLAGCVSAPRAALALALRHPTEVLVVRTP